MWYIIIREIFCIPLHYIVFYDELEPGDIIVARYNYYDDAYRGLDAMMV